jgi:hypothetical protein
MINTEDLSCAYLTPECTLKYWELYASSKVMDGWDDEFQEDIRVTQASSCPTASNGTRLRRFNTALYADHIINTLELE